MLQEVQKKIKELDMIKSGETVLVGVSGGADSVCLLLVLTALCREMHFFVEAVHIEHGIRGQESVEDARYVEKLCKKIQDEDREHIHCTLPCGNSKSSRGIFQRTL